MKDDGGPAFPVEGTINYGMSQRDYFAAAALNMSGAFATAQIIAGKGANLSVKDIANKAFEIADAMLEARKK
jgi:hypothetical protein